MLEKILDYISEERNYKITLLRASLWASSFLSLSLVLLIYELKECGLLAFNISFNSVSFPKDLPLPCIFVLTFVFISPTWHLSSTASLYPFFSLYCL